MLAFRIGGETHEFVLVEIMGSNSDGWISGQVKVQVGGFEGEFPADFNSWAFSDFRNQLGRLYELLSGTAIFTSYEKQLELRLDGNGRGQIALRGEAMDYAGTGNKLAFRLDIDQTHLPQILKDLDAALELYPARAV